MPVVHRAYVIGLLGPVIQAIGLAWQALHIAFIHWNTPMTARHLMYEPAVLLIVVGFFVSLVSIPVAIEVSRASLEEVEVPVYEPEAQASGRAHGYSSPGRPRGG
jgi:hypothetical protein